MEMKIFDTTSIIAGFIAFILILFLLTIKTDRRLPNYLLACYLLFFIQDTLAQFTSAYLYPLSPVAGMLTSQTMFFMMPALYLFVKASIYRDFKLSAKSLFHLSFYVLANLILLRGYYMVHLKGEFTADYAEAFYNGYRVKLVYGLIYFQFAIYFTLIFLELNRYRQLLVENFSNPHMGNYRWLLQFSLLNLAIDLLGLVKNILRFATSDLIFVYADLILIVNILIFISWVLIMSMKEPGMFTGIFSDMQLVKSLIKADRPGMQAEEEGGFSEIPDEQTEKIKRLTQYMEDHEPFLDASLSIYDLAGKLDMQVRDLSLLINHTLNLHFFDFVNRYRIKRAKELFNDPANRQVTVLEVLYEVGFNSKSSFNTTFKKFTGQTPTQYRRSGG